MTSESVGVLVYSKIHKRRKNIGSSHVPHESAVCPVHREIRDRVHRLISDFIRAMCIRDQCMSFARFHFCDSDCALSPAARRFHSISSRLSRSGSLELDRRTTRRDAKQGCDGRMDQPMEMEPVSHENGARRGVTSNSRSSIGHCSILR